MFLFDLCSEKQNNKMKNKRKKNSEKRENEYNRQRRLEMMILKTLENTKHCLKITKPLRDRKKRILRRGLNRFTKFFVDF